MLGKGPLSFYQNEKHHLCCLSFLFSLLMALYFIIRNHKYYFFPTPQKSCFSYLHKKYLINQHCCIIFARLILVRKYGDYWLDCLCVNLLFLFLGWEKCVNLQELSVLRPWQSWWDLDLISSHKMQEDGNTWCLTDRCHYYYYAMAMAEF